MGRLRGLLTDLRALSWRLPFVERPKQIGTYVRYIGDAADLAVLERALRNRMTRSARLGGLVLGDLVRVHHPPGDSTDPAANYPLNTLGSIGLKARVL